FRYSPSRVRGAGGRRGGNVEHALERQARCSPGRGGSQAEAEEHDWAVGRTLGKGLLELVVEPIEQPPMASIQPLATDQAPSQEEKCGTGNRLERDVVSRRAESDAVQDLAA